jgi:hypothetical protein
MSKKQKRQVTTTTTTAPRETVERREVARPRFSATEFNPDYSPVIKDLKRIGTLAGSFFIILVVLSFFLR